MHAEPEESRGAAEDAKTIFLIVRFGRQDSTRRCVAQGQLLSRQEIQRGVAEAFHEATKEFARSRENAQIIVSIPFAISAASRESIGA